MVLLSSETYNLWPSSGYDQLARDERGHLVVTDDYLRRFLSGPEMAPIDESCGAEQDLHAKLWADPRSSISSAELEKMADNDVQENYQQVLKLRDLLVKAGTLEACYLDIFTTGIMTFPPVFLDQLVHPILRNILNNVAEPMQARAAEAMFREQTATIHEGNILLGDTATVNRLGSTGGMGAMGRLLKEGGIKTRDVEMDVLIAETAEIYWPRCEEFDTVLDISFSRPGLDALCRVLEAWVKHFTSAMVSIQPVQKITDEKWVWHSGLDSEASALLNDLYEGQGVSEDRMARLLSLFRLEFYDPTLMRPNIQGRPVYLGLAMTSNNLVRLKPQNLLMNLPYNQSM
jgi:hypothetical protein